MGLMVQGWGWKLDSCWVRIVRTHVPKRDYEYLLIRLVRGLVNLFGRNRDN